MRRLFVWPLLCPILWARSEATMRAAHHPLVYKEIIVRTPQNIRRLSDIAPLVDGCRREGIDTITLLCKQDEDDEFPSGTLLYPSHIAKTASAYAKTDMIAPLIRYAHRLGIRVQAWVPQFHDQIAFKKDPRWAMRTLRGGKIVPFVNDDGEYFVNPFDPQVQRYELSIIDELVAKYDFDALILDWVRCDDYAMDLSDTTRRAFRKKYGFDPAAIDFSKESKRRQIWNRYREERIAAYIHEVKKHIRSVKPHLRLGVFILSPLWHETAQNPALFRRDIDFVEPMCYYDDWDYPLEWVYDAKREDAILPAVHRAVGANKQIVPVFDADWSLSVYKTLFAHLAHLHRAAFFAYGRWTRRMLRHIGAL